MKAKRVATGIYRDARGTLYERPFLQGKRTWRKLWSRRLQDAKLELATRRADHHRAPLGLTRSPYLPSHCLRQILETYAHADCPTPTGRPRGPRTALDEQRRIPRLIDYFGTVRLHDLSLARLRRFASRRPSRAADLDLYTLRNAIRHAAATGQIDRDPVPTWPRFHTPRATRHCRNQAPTSGDELHTLATYLFEHGADVHAWTLLLLALTGCRRSEILELRMDATQRSQPGFVEGQWLWVQRRKEGVNPFALLTPALQECIEAHHTWHTLRYPGHPFWLPHRWDRQAHADPDGLGHALRRATKALQLPHRHPHALRAFYVTVRRSQGASDAQIAAEIGDTSGAVLIAQVYGAVPPNWQGGPQLDWKPLNSPPAWLRSWD